MSYRKCIASHRTSSIFGFILFWLHFQSSFSSYQKFFFLLILIFSTGRCERHCPPTNISAILYFGRLRTCGSIRPLSVSFYHLFFLIVFFFTLPIITVTFMNDVAQRPCSYHVFHLIFTNTTFRKPVFICRVFFSCYRKETRNQTYTRETYKKHVLNGSSALNIKLNPDSLTVRWIIYCRLPFWKN